MKLAIVLGTRPEIIKMSPIIRECEVKGIDYFILHTGQHYSYKLDKVFFEELHLPGAKYNLDIGSIDYGLQMSKMVAGIEAALKKEKAGIALVEGDTNTVLAGAMAAKNLGIKLGHVEAGLRSYDFEMREETNRVIADQFSDFLFAPTEKSREILKNEGLKGNVFVTGNTVVDAVEQNISLAKKNSFDGEYFLATLHRAENVDVKERLASVLSGLEQVSNEFGTRIICPIHPRSEKMIKKFGMKKPRGVGFIEPIGYLAFLAALKGAKLVLTDSGGIQEESCVLNVPCVTIRENTERPETLEAGSNVLAGRQPGKMVDCVAKMLESERKWKNPFGDGKAAERIVEIIGEL